MKQLDKYKFMFPDVKSRHRRRGLEERLEYSTDQKIHSRVKHDILFYQISYHFLRIFLALQIYNPMIDKLQSQSPDGINHAEEALKAYIAMAEKKNKEVDIFMNMFSKIIGIVEE